MSLCLIIRDKNELWIAADTAVSVDIDGIPYRVRNETREKVFCVGNSFVFCSGLLSVSDRLKEIIFDTGYVDAGQIQKSARDLVKALPPHLRGENHGTGIMLCLDNGDVVTMVQEQDFAIIKHAPPKGIQILTGGYESVEAHALAGDALMRGGGAIDIFGEVYTRLASAIIGGDLIVYRRVNGVSNAESYRFKIKEARSFPYADNLVKHCLFAGVVKASDFQDLYGRSMLTNADSTTDYKFKAEYLDVKGLIVRNASNAITFMIDSNGNVTMSGSITLGSGSYINWSYVNSDPVATNAQSVANSASIEATLAANNITRLANGSYSGGTFISGTSISSPNIYGGRITGNEIVGSYISGGTVEGTTIRFGNWGTLQQSYGSNGVSATDLIEMYSSRGIRLQAGSGGLGLSASAGIWVDSELNIRYNGSWMRNIAAVITSMASRIAALEAAKA